MVDLPLGCTCGALTGIAYGVSASTVKRVVCHCHGCKAYARELGRYEEIVDERGGTDVFQMSPRDLKFRSDLDDLACMRISEKGALRWYAKCCDTPIAHTLASLRVPFVAINHFCVDWSHSGRSREEIIGPLRARVNLGRSRHEAKRFTATEFDLVKMLMHYLPMFAFWLLRGDARRSPFLDANSGQLIVKPIRRGIIAGQE